MVPCWWTLQDTTLIIHTEFPSISYLGVGQLVVLTSVAEQLDSLAIHTTLSSSNWTLPKISTGAHLQLDTPAALNLRRMESNILTGSLSNWTLLGSPQPKLLLTLVIRTRVPKHSPLHYIAPFWTPGYQHKFFQATGHSGYQHRICIKHLGTPIIRTRVPKQVDTPVICAETMVPGHWTMDGSICTSVS
jgi:hypothetical protein